jgi:hypothetical protein
LIRKLQILQKPQLPKMVLTAVLRERYAEDSQNSSDSSDSLVNFVGNVVRVVIVGSVRNDAAVDAVATSRFL